MWLLFALATIAAVTALGLHMRRPSSWVGETAQLDSGEDYVFQEREHKDKPIGLRIGVTCPEGFHLTLRPEGAADRFFKGLGISHEFTTRDRAFDDRVYIVAEDRRVGAILYRDAEVRAGILKLFGLGPTGLHLSAVECRDGVLWADYTGATARPTALVAREVVPALLAFAAALRARRDAAPEAPDRFAWKASVLGAVAAALVLNGFVQWYRSDFFVFPSVVDDRRWLNVSGALAFVLLAGLLLAALLWLKRSARTHFVLLEMGLVGIFGCFATAMAAVRDLNAALDHSPERTVEAQVMARHGRGRRSFAYRVSVQDWEDEYRWRTVRLPSEVYHRLPDGWTQRGWLRLHVREGALGIRYVANAAAIPAPPQEDAGEP